MWSLGKTPFSEGVGEGSGGGGQGREAPVSGSQFSWSAGGDRGDASTLLGACFAVLLSRTVFQPSSSGWGVQHGLAPRSVVSLGRQVLFSLFRKAELLAGPRWSWRLAGPLLSTEWWARGAGVQPVLGRGVGQVSARSGAVHVTRDGVQADLFLTP